MRCATRRKRFGAKLALCGVLDSLLLVTLLGCAAEGASHDVPPPPSGGRGTTSRTADGNPAVASSGGSAVAGHGTTVSDNGAASVNPGTAGVPAGTARGGAGASGVTSGSGGAAVASSGGVGGVGGRPADMNMSTTYPPLDPSAFGMPMRVANGFSLAESPLWDPCSKTLLFADVNAAGGGVIDSLAADGKVTVFMSNTANTNGIAWDIDGSLILAQMKGHVARRDRSGMVTVIDQGVTLHTPDDVVVRSDGTIYLSDGDFCPIGTLLGYGTSLPVFTIKPKTNTLINSGMVRGPNGIELSPDEKVLYVNGYGEGNIWRFEVMPDGTIMKPAMPLVSGLTDPDSMCLDAAGNLYVAVSTGIQVLRPDGTKVTLIRISGAAGSCTKAGMTNCTFGGEDGKTLYITSWTAVYKIDDMPIPGLDWIVGKKRATCM